MTARDDRGFALVAALWALVMTGAVAAAYLSESRHVLRISENRGAELRARHAARAGLNVAHNALERLAALESAPGAGLDVETRARLSYAWNHIDSTFAGLDGCPGDACYTVTVRDLGTALNVNRASEAQLRSLFEAVGASARDAEIAAQSVADWLDADDLHRARGAERSYYRARPFPDTPRNGPIAELSELRRVRGVDDDLFRRAAPHLTVEGDGRINLNAAPTAVLAALPGLGPEAVRAILDARRRGFVFTNPFQVALRLGPEARARLQDRFTEFVRLTSFEPRHIEVVSTGRYADHVVTVEFRALFQKSGDRVTMSRLARVEP